MFTKSKILVTCSRLLSMAFFSTALFSNAQAAYLTETHLTNDIISNAQHVDDIFFTNSFDADINTKLGINISTSSLHASILGSGDNSIDFYSFFNPVAGQAFFDIDYAYDFDRSFDGSFDSQINLYDSSFILLATNDDSAPESGSASNLDSFIEWSLPTADTYYVAVGGFLNLSDIPFGANYTLHISHASAVPVPAAIWLFASGHPGLVWPE
ncbi:MAG: hypothetical protein GQ549_05185 [Gammaproteobacteria bacterium]|nr:hypothetical protein [Gammaproteobacteria bacterium]